MFLQIISITPCELAFNSPETHGLHVHTRMLIYADFTAFTEQKSETSSIQAVVKKIIMFQLAVNRVSW